VTIPKSSHQIDYNHRLLNIKLRIFSSVFTNDNLDMLVTISALALAASLVPSVASSNPESVDIGYNFNGNGCPTNSVLAVISGDFQTLVLHNLKMEKECQVDTHDLASSYD